jgi:putative lipoic acid-binding regulatory protein
LNCENENGKNAAMKSNFKELLDTEHSWPDYFNFRFIAKAEVIEEVAKLFPEDKVSYRDSSKGNYRTIMIRKLMKSSDEVLEVYANVSKIKGVITL